MNDVILIETQSQWEALLSELLKTPRLAIDTESNGFYAYYERICLIQISTDTTDFIVDPMVVEDLQDLNQLFSDPAIEKVFHAAANDISGLKRDFDFKFSTLFDTAVACKMIGHRRLGLAHILKDHFGVELNKKWQRCDWGRRPLSAEQLRYARLDTHYLLPLRDQLEVELEALQLLDQAQEAFAEICEVQPPEPRFMGNGPIRVRGAGQLDEPGREVLQRLYQHRDRMARKRDRAPFRVISNEALLRLARRQPTDIEELRKIKGLPKAYRKGNHAKQILKLIGDARREIEALRLPSSDANSHQPHPHNPIEPTE